MDYFFKITFIVSWIGGVVSVLFGIMYTLKMYGQSKPAPLLLRITGISHYMSKYQSKDGIAFRNKAFVALFLFLLFCLIIVYVGAKSDPEGWKELKESYNNLPQDGWDRVREKYNDK